MAIITISRGSYSKGKEIAEKVEKVAEESQTTFVIQNNHPWGQAVANALQLRDALGEEIPHVPDTLIERFPVLKIIVKKKDTSE